MEAEGPPSSCMQTAAYDGLQMFLVHWLIGVFVVEGASDTQAENSWVSAEEKGEETPKTGADDSAI